MSNPNESNLLFLYSVGLCVDFCAHIVHGFLTGHGNKGDNFCNPFSFSFSLPLFVSDERVMYVMENIAPAVLNGADIQYLIL